jgi:antitoxin component YwqK of YwqJK toxin-antitoxin module
MSQHHLLPALVALASCSQGELYNEDISVDDPNKFIKVVYYTEDKRVCRAYFLSNDHEQGVEFGFRDHGVAWTSVYDHQERLNLYFYHENGRPSVLTNFSDAHSRTGHTIEYHSNGAIKEEGWLVKGERVGIWKEYDTSGALTEIDTVGAFDASHPGYPILQ